MGGGLINQWESGSVRIRGKKARQERGKPLVGVEKKGGGYGGREGNTILFSDRE